MIAMSEESKKDLALETYSQEDIEELKLLGMPRPAGVSYSDWYGPDKVSTTHDLMIYLAAVGSPQKDIAVALGFSDKAVSLILNKSEIKNKVKLKQAELFGDNARKRINTLANKSIGIFEEVLDSAQEKVSHKIDVAKYITDQSLGKAKQDIKVEGSLLSEFLARLDEVSKPPRDVSESAGQEDDPIDSIATELIDKVHVVGQRGQADGEES